MNGWHRWLVDTNDEVLDQPHDETFSVLMLVMGWTFWLLRRVSLHEHIKHSIPKLHPRRGTPAWFNDTWILGEFAMAVLLAVFADHLTSNVWLWVVLWIVAQTVQTNLYHNVWRLHRRSDTPPPRVYSHVRNLFISVLVYIKLGWLFGIAYWLSASDCFHEQLGDVWNSIYFSYVTGSTLGYGDLAPTSNAHFAKFLVVSQILTSILMLSIILGQAVSSAGKLQDARDGLE